MDLYNCLRDRIFLFVTALCRATGVNPEEMVAEPGPAAVE